MTVHFMDPEEIEALLKDICEYLKKKSDVVGDGDADVATLSAQDKKIAEGLIERSKKQLQKIAIFNSTNPGEIYDSIKNEEKSAQTEQRYVECPKRLPEDDPPPLPNKKDECRKKTALSASPCPFKELPARDVEPESKHGTLSLQRKMFNIINRFMKIYGAVHNNWFLMYWSITDSKPFCALDLKQCEAEVEAEAEAKKGPRSDHDTIENGGGLQINNPKMNSFKVFSQNKCYVFLATTLKDRRQWVENINKIRHSAVATDKTNTRAEFKQNKCLDQGNESIYVDIENLKQVTCEKAGEKPAEQPDAVSSIELDEIYDTVMNTQVDQRKPIQRMETLNNNMNAHEADSFTPPTLPLRNEKMKNMQGQKLSEPNVSLQPEHILYISQEEQEQIYDELASICPETQAITNQELYDLPALPPIPAKNVTLLANKSNLLNSKPTLSSKPLIRNAPSSKSEKTVGTLIKPNQSKNMVKILSQKFCSTASSSSHASMRTFSRNSTTFQAKPTKACTTPDLIVNNDIGHERIQDSMLKPVEPFHSQQTDDEDCGKPMVLLKPNIEDELIPKKLTKYLSVPGKPKKIVTKHRFLLKK